MVFPIVTRKPWALVALILNCIPIPGFVGTGTMIAASNQEDKALLTKGLIQFILGFTFILTAPVWIWSAIVGIKIYRHSEPAEVDPEALEEANRKKEEAAKARAEAKEAKAAQKAAKAKPKKDKPKKEKKAKKEAAQA